MAQFLMPHLAIGVPKSEPPAVRFLGAPDRLCHGAVSHFPLSCRSAWKFAEAVVEVSCGKAGQCGAPIRPC